jgi:transposase
MRGRCKPLLLLNRVQKGDIPTDSASQSVLATNKFFLPSYSPDHNPIEYLWRKVKKEATHNKCFEAFEHLVHSVDKTLAAFTERAQEVLNLFGCYCAELGLTTKAAA